MRDLCDDLNIPYPDYQCQYPDCDIVQLLQDVMIGGNWVKGTQDLSIISYNKL